MSDGHKEVLVALFEKVSNAAESARDVGYKEGFAAGVEAAAKWLECGTSRNAISDSREAYEAARHIRLLASQKAGS